MTADCICLLVHRDKTIITSKPFSQRTTHFVTAIVINDVVVAPFLKHITTISQKFINNYLTGKSPDRGKNTTAWGINNDVQALLHINSHTQIYL